MLYELSIREVMTLQAACAVAQDRMAENAESAERCANNRYMPKAERVGATRVAKWYRERTATFEAIRKALDEGQEITTLEQAKEALER
jgi:hypothetical protein